MIASDDTDGGGCDGLDNTPATMRRDPFFVTRDIELAIGKLSGSTRVVGVIAEREGGRAKGGAAIDGGPAANGGAEIAGAEACNGGAAIVARGARSGSTRMSSLLSEAAMARLEIKRSQWDGTRVVPSGSITRLRSEYAVS